MGKKSSIKITQIQGLDVSELLTQFQNVHIELLAIKENTQNTQKDKLLTRQQTADTLQISLVTLWTWTKKGVISANRIGNKIRYKESDIMNALQSINIKGNNND